MPPYIGDIRIFAGNFNPNGWLFCNGQLLPISENDNLFQLIGTTYGGDGEETFALPDLRGRVPTHQGNGFTLGEAAGVENVTLTQQQIPVHSHPALASANQGTESNPTNAVLSNSQGADPFIEDAPTGNMAPTSISPVGGSQPHTNMQPYTGINYIISLFGVFPDPTSGTLGVPQPFVAEIRPFPFNFAPSGWAMCNGQLLPISPNTALFSLLGTVYGGDGKSTFALPDIKGRVIVHPGMGPGLSPRQQGEMAGNETVTLLASEIPAHTHTLRASLDDADLSIPTPGRTLAKSQGGNIYGPVGSTAALSPQALAPAGGSAPHNNMQPYLTLNYCIALQGIFPQRP